MKDEIKELKDAIKRLENKIVYQQQEIEKLNRIARTVDLINKCRK